MKVHEIISESRLDEGYIGKLFFKFLDKDIIRTAERYAGKGGAEEVVAKELKEKYEKDRRFLIGGRLDKMQWQGMVEAAERHAQDRFDRFTQGDLTTKDVNTFLPPQTPAVKGTPFVPGTSATTKQVPTGIVDANGKMTYKTVTVPGRPSVAAVPDVPAVPNKLLTDYPDAYKDIQLLSDAKFLDKIEDRYKTTDRSELEKIAEENAEKAKKDTKDSNSSSSGRKLVIGKALAATLKGITWFVKQLALASPALYPILRPFYDYKQYMEVARQALDQNKMPGPEDTARFTINGQPVQTVEEWFVCYNHEQMQLAVAKSIQNFGVAALSSVVIGVLFKFIGGFIGKAVTFTANAAASPIIAGMKGPYTWLDSLLINTWLQQVGAKDLADWWQGGDLRIHTPFTDLGFDSVKQLPNYQSSLTKYNETVERLKKTDTDALAKAQEKADAEEKKAADDAGQGGRDDTKTTGSEETPAQSQEPAQTQQPAQEPPPAPTPVDKSTWKRRFDGMVQNPETGEWERFF